MMNGRIPQSCKCNEETHQLICMKCNQAEFSIGLILLARIGLSSPEDKYLPVMNQMMRISSFSGIIGGRPGKALYLIGTHGENSFIYLDPHYVQHA